MVIEALVLDLDGTLAGFNLDYRALRGEVRSFLVSAGIPASVLSINESTFEMLKKTEIFMKNMGKSEKAARSIYDRALEIVEKREFEAAKTTSLLPGVMETLRVLKNMGLKLGLCTISSQKSASYILSRFGLSGFFDAVIPRNKVKQVKPSIQHLEATLEALGVKPDKAIVIGDGAADMKCANEMEVIAVGLLTGIASEEQLVDSGANYIITSITDLPTLVERVNETQI